MEKESILNRLRGLKSKTVAAGCTEAEALAAATMLATLLDRYGFDEADLVGKQQATSIIERAVTVTDDVFPWLENVARAVAGYCDLKVWVRRRSAKNPVMKDGQAIVLFGHEPDVEVAEYLLDLIRNAATTAWSAFVMERGAVIVNGRSKLVANPKERSSFMLGMMARLSTRLDAMKRARSAAVDEPTGRTGQSLVVVKTQAVEEAYEEHGITLGKRRASGKRKIGADAYFAGAEAANKVNINAGIAA